MQMLVQRRGALGQCALIAVCRSIYNQQQAYAAEASSKDRQIAIVGGGLGGLTAARILQKHGFSPVVYESERSPDARAQGGVLDLHQGRGDCAA